MNDAEKEKLIRKQIAKQGYATVDGISDVLRQKLVSEGLIQPEKRNLGQCFMDGLKTDKGKEKS
jgi:predicted transcriptional regulator